MKKIRVSLSGNGKVTIKLKKERPQEEIRKELASSTGSFLLSSSLINQIEIRVESVFRPLNPGDGKDIEIHIKSNQVGDFGVKGRIVYYFGDDKKSVQDHTLTLPIKVRKEPGPPAPFDPTPKAPGFAGELAIIGILFVSLLIKQMG